MYYYQFTENLRKIFIKCSKIYLTPECNVIQVDIYFKKTQNRLFFKKTDYLKKHFVSIYQKNW